MDHESKGAGPGPRDTRTGDVARRAAAIDIGTNSVLLSIGVRDPAHGGVRAVVERATITRLGEGVDKTRRLADAASERTLACLRDYAEQVRQHGVVELDVVGTSALRDAQGAEAFLNEAERLLGRRPRVIAGDEEAELTFQGALSGLDVEGPVLVFDIGGGSTELIFGEARGALAERVSLDVGSVRLFERHVRSDPATPAELAAIERDLAGELAAAAPLAQARAAKDVTLVGVAGTVTTLKAVELGLAPYDGARVHGAALTLSAVESLCTKLASLPLQIRQALPGLEPKRADVIVPGAWIVRDLLRAANASKTLVSDRGVRFGLLERLLRA